MAQTIDKLFEKYLEKFENEFLNTINTNDEEAIHDLRVSVKKLRALFLFIDEAGFANMKSYSYFDNLKKVFKRAGKVREYQIHKNILQEYEQSIGEKFPALQKYINKNISDYQGAFHEFMPGLTFRELYKTADQLHKKIDGISDKELNKKLLKFIKTRVDECHSFLFDYQYEIHLHQIRKYLKHIRFIIGQKIGDVHELFEKEIDFKDTRKIEDILGDWHDRDEFARELKAFEDQLTQAPKNQNKEKLQKLKKAANESIQEDIKTLRPELLHTFSLMKNLLERNY